MGLILLKRKSFGMISIYWKFQPMPGFEGISRLSGLTRPFFSL
jgi:hypothetical protein